MRVHQFLLTSAQLVIRIPTASPDLSVRVNTLSPHSASHQLSVRSEKSHQSSNRDQTRERSEQHSYTLPLSMRMGGVHLTMSSSRVSTEAARQEGSVTQHGSRGEVTTSAENVGSNSESDIS